MKPELQRYIHINNEIERRCGSISILSQRPPVRTCRIFISLSNCISSVSVNRYRTWLFWVSGHDGAMTTRRFFYSSSWFHLEGSGEMLYLSMQIFCNVSVQQGQLNASFEQKTSNMLIGSEAWIELIHRIRGYQGINRVTGVLWKEEQLCKVKPITGSSLGHCIFVICNSLPKL